MPLSIEKLELFYPRDLCIRLLCDAQWSVSAIGSMQVLLDDLVEETFADDRWTGVECFRRFKFRQGGDFLTWENGELRWSSILDDEENAYVSSNWLWEGRLTGSSAYQICAGFFKKRTNQLGVRMIMPPALPFEPEDSTRLVEAVYHDPRRLVPTWLNIAYMSCDFKQASVEAAERVADFLCEKDPFLRDFDQVDFELLHEQAEGCQWGRTQDALMRLAAKVRDTFGLVDVSVDADDETLGVDAWGESTWTEFLSKLKAVSDL